VTQIGHYNHKIKSWWFAIKAGEL